MKRDLLHRHQLWEDVFELRVGDVECVGAKSQQGSFVSRGVDASCCRFILRHKAQKSVQDSRHTPAWVPGSWMKIRHAQAESSIDLETSIRCNHPDRWRFERIIRWEDKFSMVFASKVRSLRWAFKNIVPFQDVGFERPGKKVGWGALLDVDVLLGQSLVCSLGGHG